MSIQISKGRRAVPVRAIIYGPEGIGKTSLAAQFPDPLFLDVEGGTDHLDVARVVCPKWADLYSAVKEVADNPSVAKTVVIDTADWAERALIEHILAQGRKSSIEDFGYGKGYTILAEEWCRFLGHCDRLSAAGLHVVFCAHSTVKRLSPPDSTDGFDRYELKLTKQVAPAMKEWSDLLLFCKFKLHIVEGSDGKNKAQGGRERVMYATHSAAWDAKNRYSLPDEMPMSIGALAQIFRAKPEDLTGAAVATQGVPAEGTTSVEKAGASTAPVAESSASSTPAAAPVSERKAITPEQLAKLREYHATPFGKPLIERAVDASGEVSLDMWTEEQAAKCIAWVQSKMNKAAESGYKPEPKAVTVDPKTEPVVAWLSQHADQVNAYLVRAKLVAAGKTFRDLGAETLGKIAANPDKIARAAGIPPFGKAAA